MSIETESLHTAEAEQDREDRARELTADSGDDWIADNCPGSFGCHELLDRAALLAQVVESQLLSHPACVARPEWYRLVREAVTALNELYQAVGAEHLSADEVS